MKYLLLSLIAFAVFFAQVSLAQEDAAKDDLVAPSAYRIRVQYSNELNAQLLRELNDEVNNQIEARKRRLKLSERELSETIDDEIDRLERELPKPAKPGEKPVPFQKEKEQIQKELEAAKRAAEEEKNALRRGDEEEAKKWRAVKNDRIKRALDLAALIRELEAALEGLSAEDLAQRKRDYREISEKALEKLRVIMEEFKANQPADAGAIPLLETK